MSAAATMHRLRASAAPPASTSVARLDVAGAPAWFAARLDALAITAAPGAVWRATLVLTIALPIMGAAVGGPAVAGIAIACLGVAAVATADLGRHRRDRVVDAELPAVLDVVSTTLRSGHSLAGGLHEAARQARGPVRTDLDAVVATIPSRGVQPSLAEWRRRRATSGVRLAVAALTLSAELGSASRPVDGVASTLRDRLALQREVRALSAQARASAVVVVAAPIAFAAFMGATDDGILPFFFRSRLGLGCLAGGVLADALGAWWMLRIVRPRP